MRIPRKAISVYIGGIVSCQWLLKCLCVRFDLELLVRCVQLPKLIGVSG